MNSGTRCIVEQGRAVMASTEEDDVREEEYKCVLVIHGGVSRDEVKELKLILYLR